MVCNYCNKILKPTAKKFCSNKCQADAVYAKYVDDWKAGKVNGKRGTNAQNMSRHVIRYMRNKCHEACQLCGWNEINQTTGHCPLEVDHVDGNSDNNSENNLRLLCPNCHALTPSYRNLNKGLGREWRRLKYNKN